jgi:hypothetical protein
MLLPQIIQQREALLEPFDFFAHGGYSPRKTFSLRPRRPQI